jgi:hypothetical protein
MLGHGESSMPLRVANSQRRPFVRAAMQMLVMILAFAGLPHVIASAQQREETQNNPLSVIEAQRKALIEMTEAGPLLFRRALFVTEVPARFGEYMPRADRPFEPGEAMHIYIEPVGLVWKRDGVVWRFDATVGFEIDTPDGRPIASEGDFGRISVKNQDRPTEVMTYLTLVVSDAPPGAYVIQVKFRDVNSDKQATFRLPFTVAEAAAEPFLHSLAR